MAFTKPLLLTYHILPTPCSIKLFTPGSATPEDYNGPRSAKALADAAVGAWLAGAPAGWAPEGVPTAHPSELAVCKLAAAAPVSCRPADHQTCEAAEEPGLRAGLGPVQPRHEGKLLRRTRHCSLPLLPWPPLLPRCAPLTMPWQFAGPAAAAY